MLGAGCSEEAPPVPFIGSTVLGLGWPGSGPWHLGSKVPNKLLCATSQCRLGLNPPFAGWEVSPAHLWGTITAFSAS